MFDERNQDQIIRKDGKDCFVESLSDSFEIGKAHFMFVAYDLSKPEGERYTDHVNIYVEMAEILELCRKMSSGEMRRVLKFRKETGDRTALQEWLGGTSAEKLSKQGRSREDGMALSRVAKLLCGNKSDFLFVADSGPGVETDKGLIVPKFGGKAENHVMVSLSWDDFSEIILATEAHYRAWLSAYYMRKGKH